MKSLLITSGSSQLITQLSFLKNRVSNFNDVYILYIGLYNESLDVFFKQMSKEFDFKYIGQIHFVIDPIKLSKKEFIFYLFSRKFLRLIKLIDSKFALLKELKFFDLILIPVRVKMPVDALLLSYLKPKNVVYVADGVIDNLINREFNGWQYSYLKYLRRFPLAEKIYSPSYLKNDINKIGKYAEINIEKVLDEVKKIELARKFEIQYLKEKITHVVISQHYHLHEGLELKDDVAYFEQIINFALKTENAKVLFKPHPRDKRGKIEAIKQVCQNKALIVEDAFKALPIELFYDFFRMNDTVFLTGNSSAPLFFKSSNQVIALGSEQYLHQELNKRIKRFAQEYSLEYINL